MTSQAEASSTLRGFFHDVEERCLRAYDHLVIQNASDIGRESDRLRNDANRTYSQEKKLKKKRQGEAIKRPEEEASGAPDGAYRGKHLRMGLADLPPAPGQALGVRSQSLDSVGGADDADERKQPPPKPKRDPGTKLSGSSEALHAQDEGPSQVCGEDWRRTPPPKPKRNPDTQLSSSFDEAGAGSRDEPESVYIEMAANVAAGSRDDPDESVYEEMKSSDPRLSPRHIPQPFPNLLTHRPPLLVFPPFPPPRSPNSDESPLTPVDVTRLSMAGKKAGRPGGSKRLADQEEWPPARNVTPSGRSSAPPLPCGPQASSSSARDGDASPRSQSACPSPVSGARSRTPLSLKRPPPYNALMAGRPPEGRGAKHGGSTPPPDHLAERRSRRGAEEFKRLHPLGRSSSASGAPSTPRDHPALSQMPWLCGDVTMMETIEKKRVLCGEIKSRRRADTNPGKRDAPPAGRRKQPPPYPAAVLWDTAI